jgi:hypothetical protein
MTSESLLQVVTGKAPAGFRTQREILLSVLQAELAPGLSVEDSCSSGNFINGEFTALNSMVKAKNFALQLRAGLRYHQENLTLPGFVYVANRDLFISKFPEFQDAYETMAACGGVRILSNGEPVKSVASTLSLVGAKDK